VTLLTASYIAAGIYLSTLTAHPLIAAIGSLALLAGLWLADIGSAGTNSHWQTLSPLHHFQSFNGGLLDSGDTCFFVLFSIFFLALAIRRVGNLNP
jgi:ABC-2 type transport system permease protein